MVWATVIVPEVFDPVCNDTVKPDGSTVTAVPPATTGITTSKFPKLPERGGDVESDTGDSPPTTCIFAVRVGVTVVTPINAVLLLSTLFTVTLKTDGAVQCPVSDVLPRLGENVK